MLKGPITRATISTSLILGVRLLIQVGSLLIIARLLGPGQFGSFAGIATLAVLMGTFSTFGTHLVLLAEAAKNKTKSKLILSYAIPTTILGGLAILCLYWFLLSVLFKNIHLSEVVFICIGVTEILLLPLYQFSTMRVLAEGNVALSQVLAIFPLGLRALSAFLVFMLGLDQPLNFFSYLYLGTAVIALILMSLYKSDSWGEIRNWRLARKSELKKSAGYATLALTASGAGELDKILAVKLMPLGMSGLYIAASRTIGAVVLPVIALLLSALPRLFSNSVNHPQKNQLLLKWILISVFIYSFILMFLVWCMAPFVEWLFGSKYEGITEILKWICLVIPGFAIRLTIGSVLMTMEQPWLRAGFELLGIIILLFFSVFGFQYWGGNSVIFALIISEWIMATLGLYLLWKLK